MFFLLFCAKLHIIPYRSTGRRDAVLNQPPVGQHANGELGGAETLHVALQVDEAGEAALAGVGLGRELAGLAGVAQDVGEASEHHLTSHGAEGCVVRCLAAADGAVDQHAGAEAVVVNLGDFPGLDPGAVEGSDGLLGLLRFFASHFTLGFEL